MTMKNFSLLIKPASADCNLHCEYCFYLSKSQLYPETTRHRMSYKLLERLISSYMATEQSCYSFGWQGGEPTLMGIDFFKAVVEMQKKYGRAGCYVANGVQTNATLINHELAKHFASYNFLVGCSLDGTAELHDKYRRSVNKSPSHQRALRGIQILKRHNVEFNILVLVSKANIKHARLVYNYLLDQGFMYHQYIPCVEFDSSGQPSPFTISGNEWGDFLCELFDEWKKTQNNMVSVRLFDSILVKMVNGVSNICTMSNNCCQYFVVEYNGDIYPCDFHVQPDLKIGNINKMSWQDATASPVYITFGARKSDMNDLCKKCPYLVYCAGDCLKHRMYAGNPPSNLSWLCSGWKKFYTYAIPALEQMANKIRTAHINEYIKTYIESVK